ncbi:MAG: endopeptidase La [bacterium]|nr:endopeptidase La [bacterium]
MSILKERGIKLKNTLPLVPLRDIIVFPYMVVPLFVGRDRSIKALEKAMLNDRLILLCGQKKPNIGDPKEDDLYSFGTVAEILQLLKLPDGTVKVLIEGLARVKIIDYLLNEDYLLVAIEEVNEEFHYSIELEALIRNMLSQFEQYVRLCGNLPQEAIASILSIEDPGRLADIITAHLPLKMVNKEEILESTNPKQRLEKLIVILNSELEILGVEKKIQGRVRRQMEKSQKEYYLTERLKAIQKELKKDEDFTGEIGELKKQIKQAQMSKEAEEKALKELNRLKKMPPMMAEATVIRNYIDWLIAMPWNKQTKDKLDIKNAHKILENDHYGLDKVKERILEYLAVRKLKSDLKGPILCFVGPPGTGKTSVAKSIATALDRKFIRVSLGGVRDEAEIRGHRMTYVAALPGRIIQSMKKVKSKNPVFLLDEIDKMSVDFRGDPSAALLEVLDPEQNCAFSDHYLEVPFDLSSVMFITTANTLYPVPPALKDRLEVLEFPSYIEDEKLKIAQLFLVPRQLEEHGLTPQTLVISPTILLTIIQRYTREAGVRNLEREMATICRKIAREVVESKKKNPVIEINQENLEHYLGPPKFRPSEAEQKGEIGVVTGLAWTEVGGDVLTTEVVIIPGKGELILTGKLGEVMKESGKAALSYIRSKAKDLGLEPNFHKKFDIHIHVPEGAIPKDGPSAGITMATALVSALTNKRVKNNLAMTGEITLRGRVLPVGGIKEKILAAHRAGIKMVILPEDNEKDLVDIPQNVRKKLKLKLVDNMDEVLKLAILGE